MRQLTLAVVAVVLLATSCGGETYSDADRAMLTWLEWDDDSTGEDIVLGCLLRESFSEAGLRQIIRENAEEVGEDIIELRGLAESGADMESAFAEFGDYDKVRILIEDPDAFDAARYAELTNERADRLCN